LRYLGVTPRGTAKVSLSEIAAKAKDGDPAVNTYQVMAEARAPEVPMAGAITPSAPMRFGEARVPDFAGWPAREGIKAPVGPRPARSVEGTGRLSRQEPAAGTVLPKGSTVKLYFEPPT